MNPRELSTLATLLPDGREAATPADRTVLRSMMDAGYVGWYYAASGATIYTLRPLGRSTVGQTRSVRERFLLAMDATQADRLPLAAWRERARLIEAQRPTRESLRTISK